MDIKSELMQKNGLIAIKLAREFMTMSVDDRLSTIAAYAEKYDSARGTVQAALKLLEDHKAIGLEARGHLGTFLRHIDYKTLWQFTDLGTIMGVMPLPYSRLYEGLATGLYKTLEDKDIPFSLAYMRGAEKRIEALGTGRYDFAIVSKLAANYSIRNGAEFEIAVELNKLSYVSEHVLIFADENQESIQDEMKIGIDRTSIDHYLLTLDQCKGKKVELVDLTYNQIMIKLTAGEIDAAIWNADEIKERKLGLKYHAMKEDKYDGADTEAVIVVNKNNYGVKNLLAQFISAYEVDEYQKQVLSGKLIPSY